MFSHRTAEKRKYSDSEEGEIKIINVSTLTPSTTFKLTSAPVTKTTSTTTSTMTSEARLSSIPMGIAEQRARKTGRYDDNKNNLTQFDLQVNVSPAPQPEKEQILNRSYLEKTITTQNCVGFWCLGNKKNVEEIVQVSSRFIFKHYMNNLPNDPLFLNFDCAELTLFVQDMKKQPELHDLSETWNVLKTVMAWTEYDPKIRSKDFYGIFKELFVKSMGSVKAEECTLSKSNMHRRYEVDNHFQSLGSLPQINPHVEWNSSDFSLDHERQRLNVDQTHCIGDDSRLFQESLPKSPEVEKKIFSSGVYQNSLLPKPNLLPPLPLTAPGTESSFPLSPMKIINVKSQSVGLEKVPKTTTIYFLVGKSSNKKLMSLNFLTGEPAVEVATFPYKEQNVTLMHLDGQIFAIGGMISNKNKTFSASRNVRIFSLKEKRWLKGPQMIHGRFDFQCAVLNGDIYAVGGDTGIEYDNDLMNCAERYHNGKWELIDFLDHPRGLGSAVAFLGQIFVVVFHSYPIGGFVAEPTASGRTNDEVKSICDVSDSVVAYDPVRDKWSAKPRLTVSRAGSSAAVIESRLYIFGGGGGKLKSWDQRSIKCFYYDAEDDAWESYPHIARMNQARQGGSAIVVGSDIYIIGGNEGREPTMERFCPALNRWTLLDPGDYKLPRDGNYQSVVVVHNH